MARYDRIAPIVPPDRGRAYPCWPVLRDLEGAEREPEIGRRVRLRFLALRAVRRLASRGVERVPAESFERQVDTVREELGHLATRDPERGRLARFLRRIRQPTPLGLTHATLELGEAVEAAGHPYGAEEFYHTALELAATHRLDREQAVALRMLGRVCRKHGRPAESQRFYRQAAELALRIEERPQWAQAMDGLARLLHENGDPDGARGLYREMLGRGREWADAAVLAEALCGLCRTEAESGDTERAVEHGWAALGYATRDEQLDAALSCLGTAFLRVGLYRAAERCHWIVAHRSNRSTVRTRARVALAAVAARAGQPDSARDHLRDAIRAARKHGYDEILRDAEALLTALEQTTAGTAPEPAPVSAGEAARRIAAQVESLGEALVPASG